MKKECLGTVIMTFGNYSSVRIKTVEDFGKFSTVITCPFHAKEGQKIKVTYELLNDE